MLRLIILKCKKDFKKKGEKIDKVEKKLDKKLYIGAKIGFITNIISIIWSVNI